MSRDGVVDWTVESRAGPAPLATESIDNKACGVSELACEIESFAGGIEDVLVCRTDGVDRSRAERGSWSDGTAGSPVMSIYISQGATIPKENNAPFEILR